MPTCDFCNLDKPGGKTYVKYSTWLGDEQITNFVIAKVSEGSYTNLAKHEFFVCHGCAAQRWAIVLGIFAALASILTWFMSLGFRDNPIRAGIWTFGISFFLFLILFGPLFLNFGRKFKARLKKGNRLVEVFSESEYRAKTKING